jgi:hypothetical protein
MVSYSILEIFGYNASHGSLVHPPLLDDKMPLESEGIGKSRERWGNGKVEGHDLFLSYFFFPKKNSVNFISCRKKIFLLNNTCPYVFNMLSFFKMIYLKYKTKNPSLFFPSESPKIIYLPKHSVGTK